MATHALAGGKLIVPGQLGALGALDQGSEARDGRACTGGCGGAAGSRPAGRDLSGLEAPALLLGALLARRRRR